MKGSGARGGPKVVGMVDPQCHIEETGVYSEG